MNLAGGKVKELFQKVGCFRLVLLVLSGIVLLVFSLPEKDNATEETGEQETSAKEEAVRLEAMEQYARRKEAEVEELLEKVEGIGKVKVMITLASSEQRVPMQNGQTREEDTNETDTAGGKRTISQYESQKENVLVQKEGEEAPYVVQIYAPSVEGVVVVAKGAESGEKKKEILEAVQALFHIEAHKIKVMKMQ